jgi:hypothetical protein
MAADHTLALLQEMRGEARAFHEETRRNFGVVFHRLNVLEATVASLKADVGILLSSVPVMNERMDALEARMAAVEARLSAS